MDRPIPLWLFLLSCLIWALFTVAFGWSVKSTLGGSDRSGMFGRAAVQLSSLPTLARKVGLELAGYTSGDYRDEMLRVVREEGADYEAFQPLPAPSGIEVDGVLARAEPEAMAPGWRLLVGAYTLNGEIANL